MTASKNDDFYHKLYDRLYNKRHGYHSSDDVNTSHYPFLFSSCLNPSKISYKSVLDVGCSAGIGLEHYFKLITEKCCGIDVSKIAIERAVKKGFDARVASVTSIPFEDQSFDLVCSTDVMEHLRPEDQTLVHRECFRVSKKYVAHKIANTPEGNKFGDTELHLTCWSHDQWMDFFESLNLENWKLIYSITPDVWENIKHKVYWMKPPPAYDLWLHHNTVVVFERTDA